MTSNNFLSSTNYNRPCVNFSSATNDSTTHEDRSDLVSENLTSETPRTAATPMSPSPATTPCHSPGNRCDLGP